jgi:hypothetical protein
MNTQSDNINELAKALAAAQASLTAAKKDAVNPHFRNSYATLQSVWDAAKEVLSPNGLAVVQTFAPTDGSRMDITTTLMHTSGQWIRGTLSMNPQKGDPQGIGSAVTYGRRYALSAILGIVADEDDDGNAASSRESVGSKPVSSKKADPLAGAGRAAHIPANWKACVIHFGKNQGKTLGELPGNTLDWYITKWEAKPYNGRISDDDQVLRQMLDAAQAEIGGARASVASDHAGAADKAAARRTPAKPVPSGVTDDSDEIPF